MNSCPSGVIKTNDRRSGLHGVIHHLANFLRKGHSKSSTKNRKILRKDVDETSLHFPVTGHDPIAPELLIFHSEIMAAMGDKPVQLHKRSWIEEKIDSFSGSQFSVFMLFVDSFLTTPE